MKSRIPHAKTGFTVIELLMTVAIIGIISGMILFNHRSFNTQATLKGQVNEVALLYREAQVNASNGKELRPGTGTFKIKYGVYAKASDNATTLFGDVNFDNVMTSNSSEGLLVNNLRPGYSMTICAGSISGCSTIDSLTVLYSTTTFQTLLKGPTGTSYTYAEIKIANTNQPTQFGKVKLWSNGRIEN